jgi:hypothetical protein
MCHDDTAGADQLDDAETVKVIQQLFYLLLVPDRLDNAGITLALHQRRQVFFYR